METPSEEKLAIIVPYRDRLQHLSQYVRHIEAYFQRDKCDKHIDYQVHIIEQFGDKPFNRGALLNVGFNITEAASNYTVFHDVDYLPIWADYSYSCFPARLIWHGLVLREDYETFFGAVVMFPNDVFRTVNGFSNGYFGWGFEDTELYQRCKLYGFKMEKRDGTYMALPHRHNGYDQHGSLSAMAMSNKLRYEKRSNDLARYSLEDGLNSVSYQVLRSDTLKCVSGFENPRFVHHLINIDTVMPAKC